MSQDNPHLGPDRDRHDWNCGYTGLTPDGPLCGRPPVIHVRFTPTARGNPMSTACQEHAGYVRTYGIIDEHPIAGSACCMPGSVWVLGPPSKCILDDSGTSRASL